MALVALSVIVSTNISFADTTSYTELAPIPGTGTNCIGGNETNCVVDTSAGGLGVYINNLYKVVVAGASVLAVLMLIMGGFSYVSTDAIDKKNDGKQQINSALGGMLLVLASWVILNTINPQLVSLKITSKPLDSRSLSDVFFLMNSSQKALDSLYSDALLADARAKKDARGLQDAAANALASVADSRDIISKYYSGGLTDSDKITYFGTTDDAEIATKIAAINNNIDQVNSKAQIQLQEAQVIEALNTNAAVIAGISILGDQSYERNAFQNGGKPWLNDLAAQKNAYMAIKERLDNLPLADSANKQAGLDDLKTKFSDNISKMCKNYATAASQPKFNPDGKSATSFDTKCLADYGL